MKTFTSEGISLVIPVYNEEENIEKSVSDALPVLTSLAQDYEIIFVESGSTDNSAAILDRLAAENDRIRVIHQGAKKGLGNALREGFGNARYEYIFYMDGDTPFRMSEFTRGFPLLQQADIVCGYRINREDTPIRYIYSKVFNFLIRTLFQVKVRDVQIGFKMMRKSIFERVKLKSDCMFIDAELLIKAKNEGYRITEFGVEYLGRASGKSSVTFREVLRMARELVSTKITTKSPKMGNTVTMHDAIRLYSEQGLGIRLFIRLRHLLTPLEILENWLPREGNILDVGCGHGLFTNYMALRAPSRNIVGVEPSPAKIEVAKRTQSRVPNVNYILGDIDSILKQEPFDAITIVDVLYLLPEAKQREILKASYQLLKDSGILILKTQDTKPFWRFLWTYAQEKVMVGAGLTLGDKKLYFLPAQKIRRILEEAGFSAEYHRLPARIFYTHIAFVCRKEGLGGGLKEAG